MTVSTSPFSLGVRDLMRDPGASRERELNITVPEKMGEGLIAVEAGAELNLRVRLECLHEGILASGEVTTQARGICGRCLKDIAQPVEVDFAELFAYSSGEAFEFEVHDNHVDLEPLVRDAVVLALPFQPVCRPDCPGLDPETGEPKAFDAVHDIPEHADPRWAALAKLVVAEPPSE